MAIVASAPVPVPSPASAGTPVIPPPPAPPTASAASHPTGCPPWCKDRKSPLAHGFGPTSTSHWSPLFALSLPRPGPTGIQILARAELARMDEGDELDDVRLFLQGETDIELDGDEADIFIAQAQAWVDTLRVLRRQMG